MKKYTKLLAVVLVLALAVAMTACGNSTNTSTEEKDTLVVGYSEFSEKFSPFFSKTAYDQDAYAMTQVSLIGNDREGNLILNGIEGETHAYNGVDYEYKGIADTTVTQNSDGTVDYTIKIRDDITFSDGEPMTIDDVIFSMYVLSDPLYDGSSTFYGLPIEGMTEYRTGMSKLSDLLDAAGPDNTDFTFWTEDQQTAYWDAVYAAGETWVGTIKQYLVDAGYNTAEDSVATWAANWGYEVAEDATEADLFETMLEAYGYSVSSLSDTESASDALTDLITDYDSYGTAVSTGDSAASITGIERVDDYTVNVHMTEFDAVAIYQLSLSVAPMHYYGDASLYDYDNNSFGFVKGDLSLVKSKTTTPMGAGPYIFDSYENGVITYHANENYYLGAPKTKYVLFQEGSDSDKLAGLASGQFDITDPSFSSSTVDAVKGYNSNGELTGDVITTSTVDNLGYGYIGISALTVNVDGVKDSDASKDLRKAFQTLFAVYRDTVINSYYGDRATVIQYPISNTSWAAPRPADEGYEIAYSKDVDGNSIYTDAMTEEEKYAAALEASIGFFKAAGFTYDEATGTFTAAPTGASLTYEVMIPADGIGDHPAYNILTNAKDALATIGITLEITDLTNSADLWTALEAGECEMWAAAWGATIDPDMYQVYHSSNIVGLEGSTESNHYSIQDATLDELIMEARTSADQSFRKATYKQCLDIILDWGVELPTYQRQNAVIFSTERVNMDTVTPDITTFYGWMSEIENIEVK